jgi:16S rRNA (cytidine1402-2'-O)-methyltransferase
VGELYLCATPLGNLGDITLRALDVLRQADLIAAEDTRHTRKLLNHFDIHTPTTSYQEHNHQAKAPKLLAALAGGKRVALVTDAGTPGIADPGYLLVQQALSQGHQVTTIPGPSAAIAALVISGIRPHPFYFHGFLPRKAGERRALLAELAEDARTGIFYEAPHRLQKTLQDFCEVWGAERRVAVARELTKQFEEVSRGSFAQVAARFSVTPPLGELTIVTAGWDGAVDGGRQTGDADRPLLAETAAPVEDPVAAAQIREAVGALIRAGADTQSACKAVARAIGLTKSQVYRLYHASADGTRPKKTPRS